MPIPRPTAAHARDEPVLVCATHRPICPGGCRPRDWRRTGPQNIARRRVIARPPKIALINAVEAEDFCRRLDHRPARGRPPPPPSASTKRRRIPRPPPRPPPSLFERLAASKPRPPVRGSSSADACRSSKGGKASSANAARGAAVSTTDG
jgi:hypothetical protein